VELGVLETLVRRTLVVLQCCCRILQDSLRILQTVAIKELAECVVLVRCASETSSSSHSVGGHTETSRQAVAIAYETGCTILIGGHSEVPRRQVSVYLDTQALHVADAEFTLPGRISLVCRHLAVPFCLSDIGSDSFCHPQTKRISQLPSWIVLIGGKFEMFRGFRFVFSNSLSSEKTLPISGLSWGIVLKRRQSEICSRFLGLPLEAKSIMILAECRPLVSTSSEVLRRRSKILRNSLAVQRQSP
jgi:hypothetical protein